MNKKKLDKYEFEVIEQEYIPNKDNPKKIEITFEFSYEGEDYRISPPAFKPKQIANGQWEQQACIYIDQKIQDLEGKTQHEVPNLQGEKIENSGYDNTDPSRNYPER